MVRRARLFLLVVLMPGALCGPAFAAEPWGRDTNPGDGPKLLEEAAAVLAPLLGRPEAERLAALRTYAAGEARDHVEALKRFRNPELHPLFVALAGHEDWKVRHRALHALEAYGRPEDLPLALAQMDAEEPRLREKAVLTALVLYDARTARKLDEDVEALVDARLDAETDPHVLSALEAFERRMAKKLPVGRVHEEHVEVRADGLEVVPFLSGMDNVRQVAPGYRSQGTSRSGGSGATRLETGPWTTPLIRFGEEARAGMSLQPFANLRAGGTVYHTGLDVGACLDGGGFYAIAPGVVRLVHAGSDMGTLIVVQHHLGEGRTVNAVTMHGGSRVYVEAGEKVACGQLLTTMGMGFSIENGGHYAHLHFGLYPGEFSTTHNYGYRAVSAGLVDWYDPAHYLPLWAELGRPLVPTHRSRAALGKAADLLREGRYGAAHAEAARHGEAGAALAAELEAAVAGAVARAEAMRRRGYPRRALDFLEETARAAKGIPGARNLADQARAWTRDPSWKAALDLEEDLRDTEEEARSLVGRPDAARALWQALREKAEGSGLEERIRVHLEGVGG